jgi:hypothetical protein
MQLALLLFHLRKMFSEDGLPHKRWKTAAHVQTYACDDLCEPPGSEKDQ